MTVGFAELQALLANWGNAPVARGTAADSLLERILQVLHSAKSQGAAEQWQGDLQPLVRQLLMRESAQRGHAVHLSVPCDDEWPTPANWHAHGLATLSQGDTALLLTAEAWYPTWLDSPEGGVFGDAFSTRMVRQDGRCAADPFFETATGYQQYSCPGQREAVRAAFLMKRGDTLLVNLPTGSGKSLVGQAPALTLAHEGNLTLFVVPTVALAMDQARQMAAYFRRSQRTKTLWPLAWHGGLSLERREEIRRRMRDGTQRILFTSPEALTTSLLRATFDVANAGMLRYLVIDEAHLVTQWGDEFRPAFQALAGLRNALLRTASTSKFVTLLLSATFTSETVDTLANLFGPLEQVQMISAVHLRPEPQYWFHRTDSRSQKEMRVLEALRHAPRPFILYVSTRKDARAWSALLLNRAGLRRIARFDGATADDQREKIIGEWAANQLDGIVATSAFGVGIDKGDVRTIIHASVPETLDRFYQEVGRGGRDGSPSASLLIYDDSDWGVPERLSAPKIISQELGFERWKALYASRTRIEERDLIEIDLDAVPAYLRGSNEYNVGWNMRTLLLMARSRLIELDIEANSETVPAEANEFSPSSPLAAMATVRLRILNHAHLLADVWEDAVAPVRERTQEAAQRNFGLLKGLLTRGCEVAMTLAELYGIHSVRWPVDVGRVCGGCPSDRSSLQEHTSYRVPIAAPLQDVSSGDFGAWKSYFPWLDSTFTLVFYDESGQTSSHQAIIKLLSWLVSDCGVQEVAADDNSSVAQLPAWRNLFRRARDGVLIHRSLRQLEEEPYSPLLRVTLLEDARATELIEQVWLLRRPRHVVLLPANTRDPRNLQRLLKDTAPNMAHLNQLLPVLSQ